MHRGAPTLRPLAMRTVSLDMCKPSEEISGALSQAPDSLVPAAERCALETWSSHRAKTVSNKDEP